MTYESKLTETEVLQEIQNIINRKSYNLKYNVFGNINGNSFKLKYSPNFAAYVHIGFFPPTLFGNVKTFQEKVIVDLIFEPRKVLIAAGIFALFISFFVFILGESIKKLSLILGVFGLLGYSVHYFPMLDIETEMEQKLQLKRCKKPLK